MQITRDASWGVQVSTGYLLRVIHFDTDPVNVCLKINPGPAGQLMKLTNIL